MNKKDWINVALWSGVGLIGITGLALTVKAIGKKSRSASGKGIGSEGRKEDPMGKTILIGEQGSVNFRETPEVQACSSWEVFGCTTNLLDTITVNPVGIVKGVVKDKNGLTWYKTSRKKKSGGSVSGYVREDVVTIKY